MDLRDCLRAIRRRWWLVLAAVILSLGMAGAMVMVAVPQYATAVTFFVTTPGQGVTDSYQGGLFSQQRVKSYADLLVGDRLARAVAADATIGLTSAQIQSRVTARAVPDTVLLEMTVVDSDRVRSQLVAKALATQFALLVASLETPPEAPTPTPLASRPSAPPAPAAKPAVKVDVVSGPLLDPVPVSPRPARTLALAGLLGLLVGVAGAILRELLDVTIKSVDTLRTVTETPVLAVVPFDGGAKRGPLVMSGNPHSPRAEAFRHLRTNLQFVDVDRPVKAIVITSSVPDEGKSTTAVNLAIAFAEMGRRVLLVEGDLRRPRVADYLGLEGAIGLSNVLAGQVVVADALQQWGPYGLFVLPSGFVPPNPSELLGSRNMASLLAGLHADFDVILIDTPPLLPVTDAAVVATHADGAVLVVRSGKTAQARVRTALASLRAVDSRVLGCVLNMQPTKGDVDYYRDSYYHQESRKRGTDRRDRAREGVLAAPRTGPAPEPAGATVTSLLDDADHISDHISDRDHDKDPPGGGRIVTSRR